MKNKTDNPKEGYPFSRFSFDERKTINLSSG